MNFSDVLALHLSLETDDKSGGQTVVSFKNRQFQGNLVQYSHEAEKWTLHCKVISTPRICEIYEQQQKTFIFEEEELQTEKSQ